MGGYREYGVILSQSKNTSVDSNLNVISLDRYCDIDKIYKDSLGQTSLL